MADDRMRNKDLDKNMGGAGQKNQGNYGQQSPGHNQQDEDDFTSGQRDAGQRGEPKHMKDDFGTAGTSGTSGSRQSGGGQDRDNL